MKNGWIRWPLHIFSHPQQQFDIHRLTKVTHGNFGRQEGDYETLAQSKTKESLYEKQVSALVAN